MESIASFNELVYDRRCKYKELTEFLTLKLWNFMTSTTSIFFALNYTNFIVQFHNMHKFNKLYQVFFQFSLSEFTMLFKKFKYNIKLCHFQIFY